MARTKTRPKMRQQSPKPEQRANAGQEAAKEKFLPAAGEELYEEQMSYMKQLFLSKFSSNHERPEPPPVTRRPTPTTVETFSETTEKKVNPYAKFPGVTVTPSLGEGPLIVGPANIDMPTCPNCHSEFRDAALLEFRQHVEVCTRPTTADSGSDVSSLSPPPESPTGLLNPGGDLRSGSQSPGEGPDEEFPFPYEDNEFDLLPEFRVSELKAAESKEPAFGESRPNPLDPYENDPPQSDPPDHRAPQDDAPQDEARQDDVLPDVSLQDDALQDDAPRDDVTEGEDVQPTFKFPKITDSSKFAKSLEDMEDLPYDKLYARVANAQKALVAWQNEYIDLQRVISRHEEREPSKPRVPKAHLIGLGYEDQLESFIYGYEHNTHKSKLGDQKPLQQRIVRWPAVGRELRQRAPTHRVTERDLTEGPDSDVEHDIIYSGRNDSNDQDNGGSRRGSRIRNQTSRFNSEISQTPPRKSISLGKLFGRPKRYKSNNSCGPRMVELQLEELENNEDIFMSMDHDTDDVDSISSSAMTGDSDDLQGQSSIRIRKRQHTSDFEDELPASKRIRQLCGVVENSKGKGRGSDTHIGNDEDVCNVKSVEPNSRSMKMKNTQLNAWARDDGTRRKKQSEDTKKRWEEKKALGYTTLSGPPNSPSTKSKIKKQAAKDRTVERAENGETKQSAASRNMLRRWAEKRRAQELGLPVPKIGRYAKGQTPVSTSDADRKSDYIQASSRGTIYKKRKRTVEESGPTENGDTTENDIQPKKRRMDNEKNMKVGSAKAGTESTANSPSFDIERDGQGKKDVQEDNLQTTAEVIDTTVDGVSTIMPTARETKADQESHSTQQMQTRASGRARRQTSAAVSSSQNNTRRPSQSSSKRTATPTPGPAQPIAKIINGEPDQPIENIAIKQEPLSSPAMPKKRRGRGPNYEWVPIDPAAEAAATENDQISIEESSGKTRRTRQPKITIMDIESSGPMAKAKRSLTLKSIAGIGPDSGALGDVQEPATEDSQTKGTSSGPRFKKMTLIEAEAISTTNQPMKIENVGDDKDIEAAKALARKSKSEKMSAVMKGRWASGQMREVMAKKKANNRARKEAATMGGSPDIESPEAALLEPLQVEATSEPEPESETERVPAPISAPLPARRSSRAPKPRRIGIYDDASDDQDDFRGFMSSPLGGRSRRPAALRASQSFGKIMNAVDNEGDDDEEGFDGHNEDVIVMGDNYSLARDNNNDEVEDIDREIKKQFNSELDHSRDLSLLGIVPGIVLGKRKRKPVNNLEEAMRIELGREEEDEFE